MSRGLRSPTRPPGTRKRRGRQEKEDKDCGEVPPPPLPSTAGPKFRPHVARALQSGRQPHDDCGGWVGRRVWRYGGSGKKDTAECIYSLKKPRKKRGGQVPLPWISPDYPVPQHTHSIPQTTVLIRLGLALGFALGGLAVPGGPEACSGPWGEVGGRGECGVWGEGGGRGG